MIPPALAPAAAALATALPSLLTAYWGLAAGAVLFTLLPADVAPSFKAAVRLASCRGKTWNANKPAALGPLANAAVPQAWFLHFYALGSAVCAAVLAAAARAAAAAPLPPPPPSAAALAALALLQLHLLRRLAECALQARYPRGASMHAIAYVFGMSYYAVLPLSLLPAGAFAAAAAAAAALGGGRVAAATPSFLARLLGAAPPTPAPWATVAASVAGTLSVSQWAGVVVFAAGSVLQAAAHAALAALQRRAAAAGTPYAMPTAGVLTLCACPHYLGEIVIYAGLAAVASPTRAPPPALALVWVTVNLVMAAADARDWYRRTFPRAYPAGRAALVPGLY